MRKKSANDEKHPYMIPMKWIDGTLCFWRDNPGIYSKETIKKFEDGILAMKKDPKFKEIKFYNQKQEE